MSIPAPLPFDAGATDGGTGPTGTGARPSGQRALEDGLGLLGVHGQGHRDLTGEDVARTVEHALLARRQTLLPLAQAQVANDLGNLVDVARLQLLLVGLEAARPVLGVVGALALV